MIRKNFIQLFIAFIVALGVFTMPSTANAEDANAGGKRIVVSLSQQRVYAYSGNTLVMSIGANIRGARAGNFRIQNKVPMAYSRVSGLAVAKLDGHLLWQRRHPKWLSRRID